jgi:hypothetical protein
MRFLISIVVSLLLLPSIAFAKSGVVLDSTPQGYAVGEPWVVGITMIRSDARVNLPSGARPAIRIEKQKTGETHTFAFRRQPYGSFTARVVFPSAGIWTYSVAGLGRRAASQGWEPATIVPARTASSHAGVSEGARDPGSGFPSGWILAAAAVIIALGLLLTWRRLNRAPANNLKGRPDHGV